MKRYRLVRRAGGRVAVFDVITGLSEPVSSTVAALLDRSKVDPLRKQPPTYVDPLPLKISVERANEVSRERYRKRR